MNFLGKLAIGATFCLGILGLSSVTLAACPMLAGTYACKADQGTAELTVTQEIVNNQTIYTTVQNGDSMQTPTDNFEYPINDVENRVTGSARFTCEGAEFVSYLKGQKIGDKKHILANWLIRQSMSLNATGDLIILVTGQMTKLGNSTPINDSTPCARINKTVGK